MKNLLLALLGLSVISGCNYEDVPPAHRGRVYESNWFGSSKGFIGDVLPPGTHDIGINNRLYLVQCSETTTRESFESPSKNGVVFTADVYVRFAANCEESKSVAWILANVQPNPNIGEKAAPTPEGAKTEPGAEVVLGERTIGAHQLFVTYLRPALGAAIRDAFSAYQSDEINLKRQEIIKLIDDGFRKRVTDSAAQLKASQIVRIAQVDLSGIGFPAAMAGTMEQLANVKTQVELEKEQARKVDQQIATEQKKKELAQVQAETNGKQITEIGKLIKDHPEYLRYLEVQNEAARIEAWPKAFAHVGEQGGTVVFGSDAMNMFLGKSGTVK